MPQRRQSLSDAVYQDCKLIGFARITRDMTEQHNARLAMLESERRFRLLVQGVADYAIHLYAQHRRARCELERRRQPHKGLQRVRDCW
jgi:hypothetical protein